ncbi:uroporphyrinogen-III synthase [Erythrobacter sp. JK5]|uniref:uroporphyrinogen-III synthase n=1 Tax=Erythrobacter sp. JK5 TaxID=2829500 RepID=UPI001BAE4397|nr:uroporphyrinogen-III synthase [Erythrobacter sp. JK5]QUL38198.1 uroporphyrinogen-III synthase [Erythrobacter sp. JK5]
MTTPVLAIRPEPGLSATLEAGRKLGLDMHGCALSLAEPVAWDAPEPTDFDALLVGSANVFRHGGARLDALRQLPVHAVGTATARAAERAGFAVAVTGEGGLQSVIDAAHPPIRFLRLSGAERIDLTAADGVSIDERVVYRMVPCMLSEPAARLLRRTPVVALHSAASARQFVSECKRLHVEPATVSIAALGPRIADAAGRGWRAIHIAPHPSDSALLEMLRDMCK